MAQARGPPPEQHGHRDSRGSGTHEDPALSEIPPLLVDFVREGRASAGFTGEGARRATARHAASPGRAAEAARRLSEGEPVIPTEFI